jgi:hypothetical protein
MIAEKWEPVFARDKRVTSLRGDHAKIKKGVTMAHTNGSDR